MKLPRWLLWSMVSLSVAAALAAAGWWWIQMPRYTATRFAQAIAAHDSDSANLLLKNTRCVWQQRNGHDELRFNFGHLNGVVRGSVVRLSDRSFEDLLFGRQRLILRRDDGGDSGIRFAASQHSVTCDWSEWFEW